MLVEANNNASGEDPGIRVSAYSMQGRRLHMEDYFDISYVLKQNCDLQENEWPYEFVYFGVFDGHGGSQAASFAKNNLLKMIVSSPNFWSDQDDDVLEAIRDGFASCHSAMFQEMHTWTKTNRVLPSTAGTTASILFIRNGKFYSGHVGDSRIVISHEHPETKNWRADEITQDHKPENEIERIESVGGQVKAKIGVHRVVWKRPVLRKEIEERLFAGPDDPYYEFCVDILKNYPIEEAAVDSYQTIPFLAIARSLGDFWSFNPDSEEYVVSPEPDVMCRPITGDDKCILLATDGLWNVMNSSQATRFLQELRVVKRGERDNESNSTSYFLTDNFYDVSSASKDKNHALSLVYMAYQIWERRRLRSDNITAVVAMLSDILKPQQVNRTKINKNQANDMEEGLGLNRFQLGDTRMVCLDLTMNPEPHVEQDRDSSRDYEMLSSLDDYLIFPPSIIDTKSCSSFVRAPQNYIRLARAKCRKLLRDDTPEDEYIYIKEVSDDPEDLVRLPSRTNKKNIEVRDSSAQATQPIHDFGQPWDQLMNDHIDGDPIEIHCDSPQKSRARMSTIEEDVKLVEAGEQEEGVKGAHRKNFSIMVERYMRSHFHYGDNDNKRLGPQPTSYATEQVLSVVSENKTPSVRRSARKSATENSKRKLEIELSESPKSKRRKSHPIHTIATVANG